jgi:hypothetical protein
MSTADPNQLDPIGFAQKVLALLDTGVLTTTYKLATLTAIVDLCAETAAAPDAAVTLSARTIGYRVFETLWSQAIPFATVDGRERYLRHGTLSDDKPDLVVKIARFRELCGLGRRVRPEAAREVDSIGVDRLVDEAVTTVIRMPLPKLQRLPIGGRVVEDRFLYDYSWPDEVSASRVRRPEFDDRVLMRAGVASLFARLGPLIRPAIQQRWVDFVALRSRDLVDHHDVHEFLFGASRIDLTSIRNDLTDLQAGACFYCGGALATRTTEIDHFIAWSRHPDNGLDNLVAAHGSCNNYKRDSLAALEHLERWLARFRDDAKTMVAIAEKHRWPRHPTRTLAAARSNYLWLPDGTTLWRGRWNYELLDPVSVRRMLEDGVEREIHVPL